MGQVFQVVGYSSTSSATTYAPLNGYRGDYYVFSDSGRTIFSTTGILTKLYVKLTAPLAQGSITFTALKNGSATSLTITISQGEQEKTSEVAISISPGDKVNVRVTKSGTTQGSVEVMMSRFFALTPWECNLGGSMTSQYSDAGYLSLMGNQAGVSADNEEITISQQCYVSDLMVVLNAAPGTGKSWTFTVLKNQVATALTVTITGSATTGTDLDPLHTVTFDSGDKIELTQTPSGIGTFTAARHSYSVKASSTTNMSYIGGEVKSLDCGIGPCVDYGRIFEADDEKVGDLVLRRYWDDEYYVGCDAEPWKTYRAELVKYVNGEEVATGIYVDIVDNEPLYWGVYSTVVLNRGEQYAIKLISYNCSGHHIKGNPFVYGFSNESLFLPPDIVAPTLLTNPCTDIASTTLTANGSIVTTGGINCYRRGFCYKAGATGTPTVADSVEYEDGEFGVGDYSLGLTGLTPSTPYRVRAYAYNIYGIGYGNTVGTLIYPSDSMARVSSIRRIYHPGLYRMEVALGDLGFDGDVAEAAIKKIVGEVMLPEVPPAEPTVTVPQGTVLTPEDWAKIIAEQQKSEWYKAITNPPTVSTHTTAPAPPPPTFKPSSTDKIVSEKAYPYTYEQLKYGLQEAKRWGGCKGWTVEQYAASMGFPVPPH